MTEINKLDIGYHNKAYNTKKILETTLYSNRCRVLIKIKKAHCHYVGLLIMLVSSSLNEDALLATSELVMAVRSKMKDYLLFTIFAIVQCPSSQ